MGVIGVWGQAGVTSAILDGPNQPLWLDLVLIAVSAVFFLGLIAYRVGWAGIKVHRRGLVVRNPFRRYEVRWSEVVGFTAGNFGLLPKVGVETRGGQVIPVAGLPVSGGEPGGSVGAALAALRKEHDHHSGVTEHEADSEPRPVDEATPLGRAVIGGLVVVVAVTIVVQFAGGLSLTLDGPAAWACAATLGYAAAVYVTSRPLLRNRNAAGTGRMAALVFVELTMAFAIAAGGAVAGLLSGRSAPLIVALAMSAVWIGLMATQNRHTRLGNA